MATSKNSKITQAQGLELLKDEVKTVLLIWASEGEHGKFKLDISLFKSSYQKVFGQKFKPQKYGLMSSLKLSGVLQSISDTVSVEKAGSTQYMYMRLKRNRDDITGTSKTKVVGSLKHITYNTGKNESSKLPSSTSTCMVANTTSNQPNKVHARSETHSPPSSLLQYPSTFEGLELLKDEVKTVLRVQTEDGKLDISQFQTAYHNSFWRNFNPQRYGLRQNLKISDVLESISDTLSVEQVGSAQYMRLKPNCDITPMKECLDQETGTNRNQPVPRSEAHPPPPSLLRTPSPMHFPGAAVPRSEAHPPPSSLLGTPSPMPLPGAHMNVTPVASTCSSMTKSEIHSSTSSLLSNPDTMLFQPPKARPSFRDIMNQQQEEDTCMNVQVPGPLEKSFIEAQNIGSSRVSQPKKRRRLTPLEVNRAALEIIETLSENHDYVCLQVVKARLFYDLGAKSISDLGYRRDIDIPALQDLVKLHSKLDLYAHAYVMVHSVSTLKELGQGMASLEGKENFLDLKVGPLVKLPAVYKLFKAPSDTEDIQRITTFQVLKHLNQYLSQENKWTTKVDLTKFVEYLCHEYNCDSPYELGVRIQSIGLGIAVLKRAQKAQSEKQKEAEKDLIEDMARDVDKRCKKIKTDLLGSHHGDGKSLIEKLLGSSPSDIITNIFDHCLMLFNGKPFKKVSDFCTMVSSNKTARSLFGMAMHRGCKAIVQGILDEWEEDREALAQAIDFGDDEVENTLPPNEGEVTQEIKKWLTSADSLDLPRLARIEEQVTSHFPQFQGFSALGHGAFLVFLTKHKELIEIMENLGMSISSSSGAKKCGVVVAQLNNVLDFIIQCGAHALEVTIERGLCEHYDVENASELGLGSMKSLQTKVSRRQNDIGARNTQSVIYQSALLSKDGAGSVSMHDRRKEEPGSIKTATAGTLGWKTKEDALSALASTPLLVDMASWTQWSKVYGPCHGGLNAFIEREGFLNADRSSARSEQGDIRIMALETSPGKLLKINPNTTPEDFKVSVNAADPISTAGQLVSMVVRYGSLQATPLTLLANHMRSALTTFASADQEDGPRECSSFVLKCLCRIPYRLCVALAPKMFLEPLAEAVGATVSPGLLLACCSTTEQQCCLHRLGLAVGQTHWIADFNHKMARTEEKEMEMEIEVTLKALRPVAIVKPVPVTCVESKLENEEDTEMLDLNEKPDPTTDEVSEEFETEEHQTEGTSIDQEADENVLTEDPCRILIEEIRREEFGIGIELGEEEAKLVQKQREREGRSLHRLSTELYSRDTHFVLELVQNADDNSYADDITEAGLAAIVFVIDDKRIVVLNNEIGFCQTNIRALCDVGKSTKGAHRYGYIGQKGIGFKSVFRVTDQPEVHSNGYHIRFDANSGPSGYILPHWIGDERQTQDDDPDEDRLSSNDDNTCQSSSRDEHVRTGDEQYEGWTTRIVLPLKDSLLEKQKYSLSARFHDVNPSLLLFLHRLRSITIFDKTKKIIEEMKRDDLGNNMMEISHRNGKHRWLVIKKQLDASDRKESVEMTELALAFPMYSEQEQQHGSQRVGHHRSYLSLPLQNVFAYLPLRSYGFRFIIQGDFEVPSSREDVDGDKAWNQWLREEIPKLFVDAFDTFRAHPSFTGLSSVAIYFQFVPLEKEILDFFTPVATRILALLQGMDCLPVELASKEAMTEDEDANSAQANCKWVQPCKAIVCEDVEVHKFVTPSLLEKHLGLHYLVPEVASSINPALRTELRIDTLSVRHLIEICRAISRSGDDVAVAGTGTEDSEVLSVVWVAQWLQCVYRCLEQERDSSQETLDAIASLDVFPISDGSFVNLRGQSVFFPLSLNQSYAAGGRKAASKSNILQVLERDLSTLHGQVFTCLDSVGRSQVEQLLKRLGIRSWAAKEVISSHILPTLKSDKWKGKENDILRSYLVYIHEQRLSDPSVCNIEELKGCVQVLTNKGPKNPSKEPVHFTTRYGNPLDLTNRLPSISWTLVDDTYLDSCVSTLLQEWEKFLTVLGVQHFLAIERKQVILNKHSLAQSPWSDFTNNLRDSPGDEYVIDDYRCVELEEFMQSESINACEARTLAESLDKHWAKDYAVYADSMVPVKDKQGQELGKTYSSFCINLKTKPWLPCVEEHGAGWSCRVPAELFHDTDAIMKLLADTVAYTDVSLTDRGFINMLGIRTAISWKDLLDQVISWSQKSRQSAITLSLHNQFLASLPHMKRVYSFLFENCKFNHDAKAGIYDAFLKHPLIFVPSKDNIGRASAPSDMKNVGFFYHKKEVCWNDPSTIINKLRQDPEYAPRRHMLEPSYREIYDFLIVEIKVDATPNIDEYVDMATAVVGRSVLPTPAVVEDILKIFAVLGQKCLYKVKQPNYHNIDRAGFMTTEGFREDDIDDRVAQNIKARLEDEEIFPSTNRWVSLNDNLIIPDDKRLKGIFQKEKVHFLEIRNTSAPRRSQRISTDMHEHVDLFLKACNIPRLSDCVEEELTPKFVEWECYQVQMHFHKVIPYIQRHLYTHAQKQHEQLQEEGMATVLGEMRYATVADLEVIYRLSTHPEVTVALQEKCGIEKVGQTCYFYTVKDQVHNTESLNNEIAKFIIGGRQMNTIEFKNFISALTFHLEKDLDSYLRDQDLEELPEGENRWNVQEPELPKIETPEPQETDLDEDEDIFMVIDKVTPQNSDGGLHCWPPRSSAANTRPTSGQESSSSESTLKMWPPPAPPTSMQKQSAEDRVHGREGKPFEQGNSTVHDNAEYGKGGGAGTVVNSCELAENVQHDRNTATKSEALQAINEVETRKEQRQELPRIPADDRPALLPGEQQKLTQNVDNVPMDDVQTTPTQLSTVRSHSERDKVETIGPSPRIPRVFAPYNAAALDLEFEELPTAGEILLPDHLALLESVDKEVIGRWGEQFVYEYLKDQASKMVQEDMTVEIKWINEQCNTLAPYDMEIIQQLRTEGTEEPTRVVTFIEVKSTSTENKEAFEISVAELKFALENRGALHLYRVYNAGNPNRIRLQRLRDVASNLEKKTIKICMVI